VLTLSRFQNASPSWQPACRLGRGRWTALIFASGKVLATGVTQVRTHCAEARLRRQVRSCAPDQRFQYITCNNMIFLPSQAFWVFLRLRMLFCMIYPYFALELLFAHFRLNLLC